MAKKTVKYNKTGVDKLPNDKPVVYQIQTETGTKNYIGSAQKGRVSERIKAHIGEIPGVKVTIAQHNSIADARKAESAAIEKNKPKYQKREIAIGSAGVEG